MINKIAWNTFKNTGNIDTFIELKQIEELQKNIIEAEKNGNYKDQGNSDSGT